MSPARKGLKSRPREARWLRIAFLAGAVTDGFAVVPMVVPGAATAMWGLTPTGGPYYLAMGSAASLMLGWTGLLAWAWRRPLERRAVAALTMGVIVGLVSVEILGIVSGWVLPWKVIPTLILQGALLTLFATAYGTSVPRGSGPSASRRSWPTMGSGTRGRPSSAAPRDTWERPCCETTPTRHDSSRSTAGWQGAAMTTSDGDTLRSTRNWPRAVRL